MKINIYVLLLLLFIIVVIFSVYMCYKHFIFSWEKIELLSPVELNQLYTTIDYKKRFDIQNYKNPLPVDMIYCCAMPKRKQDMIKEFAKLGIRPNFFNAITPKDITKAMASKMQVKRGSKTDLAVCLSFLYCCLDAQKNNYKNFMFFEDDINIKTKIDELIFLMNKFNESSYDIFYPGYCALNCSKVDTNHKYLFPVNIPLYCFHALVVKSSLYSLLLNDILPLNTKDNHDWKLAQWIKQHNVKACVTYKSLFDQNREKYGSIRQNAAKSQHETCIFNKL